MALPTKGVVMIGHVVFTYLLNQSEVTSIICQPITGCVDHRMFGGEWNRGDTGHVGIGCLAGYFVHSAERYSSQGTDTQTYIQTDIATL